MHPYRQQTDRAFWSRAFADGLPRGLLGHRAGPLVPKTATVVSAGSCFAANLVPFLERAGLHYLRTERLADWLRVPPEAMGYGRYSAAYGNVYTARQLLQLLRRACGRFAPAEDRWCEPDRVVDPYRPGLRYAARTEVEFEALTRQHLALTRQAFAQAGVFILTLGLTEAWTALDGAVFPACPGTVAGRFDPDRHRFVDFSCAEVSADLTAFVQELRVINAGVRIILTVSPVPLVATAGDGHVLTASTYAKSVLRVAAEEVSRSLPDVIYFPAYEIVTGPQAPAEFFAPDRRSVGEAGIRAVMATFLDACGLPPEPVEAEPQPAPSDAALASSAIVEAEC
ncbi:GSCFA domain-containing protein, partial [Methylobacterium trifolii]